MKINFRNKFIICVGPHSLWDSEIHSLCHISVQGLNYINFKPFWGGGGEGDAFMKLKSIVEVSSIGWVIVDNFLKYSIQIISYNIRLIYYLQFHLKLNYICEKVIHYFNLHNTLNFESQTSLVLIANLYIQSLPSLKNNLYI